MVHITRSVNDGSRTEARPRRGKEGGKEDRKKGNDKL
jgi:hypothetical protein